MNRDQLILTASNRLAANGWSQRQIESILADVIPLVDEHARVVGHAGAVAGIESFAAHVLEDADDAAKESAEATASLARRFATRVYDAAAADAVTVAAHRAWRTHQNGGNKP